MHIWQILQRYINSAQNFFAFNDYINFETILYSSSTIMKMMENGTINFTVYSNCQFLSDNLDLQKPGWHSAITVMIMVICGTRLFIELIELFQVHNIFKYLFFMAGEPV